jgi:hypothetical protein
LGPPLSRACDNCVAWSVFSIYLFLYAIIAIFLRKIKKCLMF